VPENVVHGNAETAGNVGLNYVFFKKIVLKERCLNYGR
jgi:hypothetical protein